MCSFCVSEHILFIIEKMEIKSINELRLSLNIQCSDQLFLLI